MSDVKFSVMGSLKPVCVCVHEWVSAKEREELTLPVAIDTLKFMPTAVINYYNPP